MVCAHSTVVLLEETHFIVTLIVNGHSMECALAYVVLSESNRRVMEPVVDAVLDRHQHSPIVQSGRWHVQRASRKVIVPATSKLQCDTI